MAVELFLADGVMWIVEMPAGPALATVWPDMEWIEALASDPAVGPELSEEVWA